MNRVSRDQTRQKALAILPTLGGMDDAEEIVWDAERDRGAGVRIQSSTTELVRAKGRMDAAKKRKRSW